MKEGGTGLHKTIREINLAYKELLVFMAPHIVRVLEKFVAS